MPKLRDFLSIESYLMWAPNLWEERSDSFRKKKIISSEISTVELIQMDFNRRQWEINLRFKMNCDL